MYKRLAKQRMKISLEKGSGDNCKRETNTKPKFVNLRNSLHLKSVKQRFKKNKSSSENSPPSHRRKYVNYTDFIAKTRDIESDPASTEWDRLKVKIESRRYESNLWEEDLPCDEEVNDEYQSEDDL